MGIDSKFVDNLKKFLHCFVKCFPSNYMTLFPYSFKRLDWHLVENMSSGEICGVFRLELKIVLQ